MKVFLKTFGCKANQYDTELLRTQMESTGALSTENHAQADLCVVNSCSVTAVADKECRQFVRRLLRENEHARIVVTGCYATHAPTELTDISPRLEVYSNADKANLPACLGFEVSPDVFGLSRFSTRSRAFVKIQDGCQAPCRYCIIPTTRPNFWNKPWDQVLKEVQSLVAEGHGEVVFTGIRLGLYSAASSEGGERLNLEGLLKKIVALPGSFRVRLSSLEVTELSDGIVELAADTDKICRHFHIPMQSGEDGVLKDMGRWYRFAQYQERVSFIRKLLPDCGLTADVMVGFPTESEESFATTQGRIDQMDMSDLHVFRYSSRPGTKAAELPPLDQGVVRDRAGRLLDLTEVLKKRFKSRFLGQKRQVLAEPSGEGWTDNYIRVPVPDGTASGQLLHLPVL